MAVIELQYLTSKKDYIIIVTDNNSPVVSGSCINSKESPLRWIVDEWIESGKEVKEFYHSATIHDAKTKKVKDIILKLKSKKSEGLSYDDSIFETSERTATNAALIYMESKYLIDNSLTDTVNIPDIYNNVHVYNPEQAFGYARAFTSRWKKILEQARLHKDAVLSLESIEEVDSYDINMDW